MEEAMRTLRVVILLMMMLYSTSVSAYAQGNQIVDLVEKYGCDTLYMVRTPTEFHNVAVKIIGYTPLPQTIEEYAKQLRAEKCPRIDRDRVIWNICGPEGNANPVCEDWKQNTALYKNMDRYNRYYLQAAATSGFDWAETLDLREDNKEAPSVDPVSVSSPSGAFGNAISIIVIVLGLVVVGYFIFPKIRNLRSSNQMKVDDYVQNDGITIDELVE